MKRPDVLVILAALQHRAANAKTRNIKKHCVTECHCTLTTSTLIDYGAPEASSTKHMAGTLEDHHSIIRSTHLWNICEITKFESPACRFHVWQNLWKAKPHKHRGTSWKAAEKMDEPANNVEIQIHLPGMLTNITVYIYIRIYIYISYVANWGNCFVVFRPQHQQVALKEEQKWICRMWNADSPFSYSCFWCLLFESLNIVFFISTSESRAASSPAQSEEELGCEAPRFRMEITAV